MSLTTTEESTCDAHLHTPPAATATSAEVEALKQALLEKQAQLLAMEAACLRESDHQVELEDSVIAWQDKYDRLYESHKRVQKVNQSLEDKLLKLVDRNSGERAQLTSDVATLSVRLAQANFNIAKLQREVERYKADINLAIQLLQCKPDSFLPQKVSSLPIDIQSKVSAYTRLETNSHSDSEGSTSGVGIATTASYKVLPASDSPPPAPCPFPPTAMVYSMRGLDAKDNAQSTLNSNNNNQSNNNNHNNTNSKEFISTTISNNDNIINNLKNANNNNNHVSNTSLNCTSNGLNNINDPDMISPIVMAKFLEDELKAGEIKHCDTCQCSKQDLTVLADVSHSYSVATQTPPCTANTAGHLGEPFTQLCLRCHSNLNSPSRTNSPYLMKLVKSSDSVISETKSSVSDLNDMDKLFTPAKKDDLMVNPILGHHRLCDRTTGANSNGNEVKLSASILYPTTHLGTYAAEKYLLETNSLGGPQSHHLRGTGYQRRFLDGGGTALELLGSYEKPITAKEEKCSDLNGNEECEDEAKPLLSVNSTSQSNLLDVEKTKTTSVEVAVVPICEELRSPASACSAGNAKNTLVKSAISGSVNSLWSKTSSCEGAKLFENFNRNLIKTIKAENPKYRGPRLCAMRIQQNGQSNILLDNIESIEAVTPVIYKRRERLLDEELDDTKDIITSKSTSMLAPSATTVVTADESQNDVNSKDSGQTDLWARNVSIQARRNEIEEELQIVAGVCKDTGQTDGADVNLVEFVDNDKGTEGVAAISGGHILEEKTVSNCAEQLTGPEAVDLVEAAVEQQKALCTNTNPKMVASGNFDLLRNEVSSKNSHNSKSCTQSSSISDAIEFQESVILRRQQLNRVAEWVQNNTQQLEQQQQQQQQQLLNGINHCDRSSGGTDRQSSFSTLDHLDSVSIEKLSMDSGYKTTPQAQTNGYADHQELADVNKSTEDSLSPKTDTTSNHNGNNGNIYAGPQQQQKQQHLQHTYFRRTTRSGLPVACTNSPPPLPTTPPQLVNAVASVAPENGHTTASSSCTTTPTLPDQPTCDILNYKYYPSDSDKTRAIKAELHTTTQHVDIAQMEYNVKQFLLKQNEWSMRCSRTVGSKGAATSHTTTSSYPSSAASQAVSQVATSANSRPHTSKALRHIKLFNSAVGFGPGVGERICVATTTTVPTTVTTTDTMVATSGMAVRAGLPQRTETNL